MLEKLASELEVLHPFEMAEIVGGIRLEASPRFWASLYRFVSRQNQPLTFALNGNTYTVTKDYITIEGPQSAPVCGIDAEGNPFCYQMGSAIRAITWQGVWEQFKR